MNKKFRCLLLFNVMLFSLNCVDKPITSDGNDQSIQAVGTYASNEVNKEEWGDFQLVLGFNKSHYSVGESIFTKLYFKNIGQKTIVLDGILPYRNSANPPLIEIWSNGDTLFQIDTLLDNLYNDNKIVISPDRSVRLMTFDLMNVSGWILTKDADETSYEAEEIENIGIHMVKGVYEMRARFLPTPQIYGSETDTLTITIDGQ